MEVALGIGLFGLFGMTWFFPALGRTVSAVRRKPRLTFLNNDGNHNLAPAAVAILIPAHNEEAVLGKTLGSIARAVAVAKQQFPHTCFRLKVGADGCSDHSGKLAAEFGAEVFEFEQQGKWKTLEFLVRDSGEAEWVILADAGVLWEERLLVDAMREFSSPEVMAVAPTYRNPHAGRVEEMLWLFERTMKSLENATGGPVSIHGATVMYRREPLVEVLDELDRLGSEWLNDDVVVPLALRTRYPERRIRYLSEVGVHDQPASAGKMSREFGRRRRMVIGNIQWMLALFPAALRRDPVVSILAMRRIFRLFWAYWGVIAGLGVAAMAVLEADRRLGSGAAGTFLAICVASVPLALSISRIRRPLRGLLDAAVASLLAPLYLLAGRRRAAAGWK